jgi:hypothetical protein
MAAADDIESIDHAGKGAGGFLTVAGSRADRVDDLDLVLGLSLYSLGRIEKSLGFNGSLRYDEGIPERRQACDLGFVPDNKSMVRCVSFNTDHLGMIGIADDDDMTALLGGTGRELLDTGHEGARRIDNLCGFFFELALDLRGHTVGSNNGGLSALDLYGFIDSGNAMLAQALHFLVVVDQWAEAANYLTVFEGLFDHLDRSFDAKAKSVFVRQ